MLSPEETKLLPARYDPKTGEPKPIRQMRPREVDAAKEELRAVENLLDPSRAFVNGSVDVAEARRYASGLKAKIEEETPAPFSSEERDAAVRLEERLREQWRAGMPTQEEMRRNPAGAIDKHMAWERRAKPSVLAWKNLRQRMLATGMIEGEVDASNIEMFRPRGGPQQLNMHNEQIPGAVHHLPPPGAGPATVFSDQQIASMPDAMRAMLAVMSNEQRAALKRLLAEGDVEVNNRPVSGEERQAAPVKRGRKPMTEEQKQVLRERLAKAREAKQAKQQES